MNRQRLGSAITLALVLLCLTTWTTRASAADTFVSGDGTAANVTAYGGIVAWSTRVGPHRYRLAVLRAGETDLLPVRSSRKPIDPDLGPGRHGVVAVYSRCGKRGCRLYRFDFESEREDRLRGGSPARRCRRLAAPSYWKGRLAYIGLNCRGSSRGIVYVRFTSGRVRLLLKLSGSGYEDGIDVRGGLVAASDVDAGGEDVGGPEPAIVVLPVSGRPGWVAANGEETGEGLTDVSNPILDAGFLYWRLHEGFREQSDYLQGVTTSNQGPLGRDSYCENRLLAGSDPPLGEPSGTVSSVTVDREVFYVLDGDVYRDTEQPADTKRCQD